MNFILRSRYGQGRGKRRYCRVNCYAPGWISWLGLSAYWGHISVRLACGASWSGSGFLLWCFEYDSLGLPGYSTVIQTVVVLIVQYKCTCSVLWRNKYGVMMRDAGSGPLVSPRMKSAALRYTSVSDVVVVCCHPSLLKYFVVCGGSVSLGPQQLLAPGCVEKGPVCPQSWYSTVVCTSTRIELYHAYV